VLDQNLLDGLNLREFPRRHELRRSIGAAIHVADNAATNATPS